MYNKYIVIITAENKEKYIASTIFSCIENNKKNNLKIFVTYKNLSNEKELKKKFRKYKNIFFVKSFIKKEYPTQDQLYKIKNILKFVKNEWILLLDGDDLFKPNKIKILDSLNLNKKKVYLHNHDLKFGESVHAPIYKSYKNLYIYKKLFNDWPQKIVTSSIVINGNVLKKFYNNYNVFKWKYLAIDVQIIIFYYYKNNFEYIDRNLTTKIENINNLDKTFLKLNKKIYWLRRMEQHNLTKEISNKLNILDRLITFIFLKIL